MRGYRFYSVISTAMLSCVVFSCSEVLPELEIDGTPICLERGGIRLDGSDDATMSSYEQWIRSAFFVDTKGASTLSIPAAHSIPCKVL